MLHTFNCGGIGVIASYSFSICQQPEPPQPKQGNYKLRINVTKEHLFKGERNNSLRCPISLAIHEVFPKAQVGYENIFINYVPTPTPLEASGFMLHFDRGERCEPFSFELDIPDEVLAGIDITNAFASTKNLELIPR